MHEAKFNKIRPNFFSKKPNFINVLTWYQSNLVQLISSILNLSSKVFNFTKMKQFYFEHIHKITRIYTNVSTALTVFT